MSATTTLSTKATTTSTATPSCTTAVGDKYGRVPLDACNSYYNYDPSYGAAIGFSVLFGLVTITHLVQAVTFRKAFCWVIIMGALWETVSFITRALGSHDQQQLGYAMATQLLLLLAPLWVNAFVYMTFGRMIYYFLPEKKLFGIKAPSLARYFVGLDIVSFIIQGVGGSMISPGADPKVIQTGIHVYMGGIGLQEFFIVVFIGLVVTFHRRMLMLEHKGELRGRSRWMRLTFTIYGVLALITMRIIYRLVEYAKGAHPDNPLPFKEVYTYTLDAAPMLIAILLLCIVHPGMVMVGPASHFPSRKEKRALKKERKERKQAEKEEREMRGTSSNRIAIGGIALGHSPPYDGDAAHQMA
ncbi:MAG: hypothetical protein M1826_006579 [Phylliscum demangeonii]|nr:MAG: hypothetical protein M1826_006579 [Phylliscum demangeonii]